MSNDEWGTPKWLFDLLDEEFKFDLDVCASKENHKCRKYYTQADDGLTQEWKGACFCNPPYSNQMPWVAKAAYETRFGTKCSKVVMLLMCDTSTENFDLCWRNSDKIRLINHRIKFEGAKGSPRFASMVVVFERWKPLKNDPVRIVLVDYRNQRPYGE